MVQVQDILSEQFAKMYYRYQVNCPVTCAVSNNIDKKSAHTCMQSINNCAS